MNLQIFEMRIQLEKQMELNEIGSRKNVQKTKLIFEKLSVYSKDTIDTTCNEQTRINIEKKYEDKKKILEIKDENIQCRKVNVF